MHRIENSKWNTQTSRSAFKLTLTVLLYKKKRTEQKIDFYLSYFLL